jgi:peroxiredoxin
MDDFQPRTLQQRLIALAGLAAIVGVLLGVLYVAGVFGSSGDAEAVELLDTPVPAGLDDVDVGPRAGDIAPDFELSDFDGDRHRLSDYRGQVVFLNFWATWCVPCVAEMPALDRLRAHLAGRGIEVLALSSDRGGAAVVRAFFAKHGIEHLPVTLDQGLSAARALGVQGLPTTVLIDGTGRDRGRLVGAAEWDSQDAIALVEDCLIGRQQ